MSVFQGLSDGKIEHGAGVGVGGGSVAVREGVGVAGSTVAIGVAVAVLVLVGWAVAVGVRVGVGCFFPPRAAPALPTKQMIITRTAATTTNRARLARMETFCEQATYRRMRRIHSSRRRAAVTKLRDTPPKRHERNRRTCPHRNRKHCR